MACRSSEWGVLPFHWYFTSALPRSLLGAFPLAPLGLKLEPRIRPILLLTTGYVILYSFLPHKEVCQGFRHACNSWMILPLSILAWQAVNCMLHADRTPAVSCMLSMSRLYCQSSLRGKQEQSRLGQSSAQREGLPLHLFLAVGVLGSCH